MILLNHKLQKTYTGLSGKAATAWLFSFSEFKALLDKHRENFVIQNRLANEVQFEIEIGDTLYWGIILSIGNRVQHIVLSNDADEAKLLFEQKLIVFSGLKQELVISYYLNTRLMNTFLNEKETKSILKNSGFELLEILENNPRYLMKYSTDGQLYLDKEEMLRYNEDLHAIEIDL